MKRIREINIVEEFCLVFILLYFNNVIYLFEKQPEVLSEEHLDNIAFKRALQRRQEAEGDEENDFFIVGIIKRAFSCGRGDWY